jgi:hypothetical protein
VIGINAQIYGWGAYEGISFAIPINLGMDIEKHGGTENVDCYSESAI